MILPMPNLDSPTGLPKLRRVNLAVNAILPMDAQ